MTVFVPTPSFPGDGQGTHTAVHPVKKLSQGSWYSYSMAIYFPVRTSPSLRASFMGLSDAPETNVLLVVIKGLRGAVGLLSMSHCGAFCR